MDSAKLKILIVEDEPGFRRTYCDLFRHHGHQVVEAADGEEGTRLAFTEKPDLVLLDLIMPKVDGYQVLQALRKDKSTETLPIVIFSVLGEQSDIQKALKLGANDYIVKGFYSPSEVLAKIGKLIVMSNANKLLKPR